MAHVCPVLVGYLLLSPLRRLAEHPERMLRPLVREGMAVLEPGCAMGYFTVPLARMVGAGGRVVAVDLQEKMLARLRRRADAAGLLDRIEIRQASAAGLGVDDLAATFDLAVAIHVVHEVPDQSGFLAEIGRALRPGGRLLLVEPKGHVSARRFQESLEIAQRCGLEVEPYAHRLPGRAAVLVRPDGGGHGIPE